MLGKWSIIENEVFWRMGEAHLLGGGLPLLYCRGLGDSHANSKTQLKLLHVVLCFP